MHLIHQAKTAIKYAKIYQNRFTRQVLHEKANAVQFCYDTHNKLKQYRKLFDNVKIVIQPDHLFQHWIDESYYCININSVIDNSPPNYEVILLHSLNALREQCKKYNNAVSRQNVELLDIIEDYIDRIIESLKSTSSAQAKQTALYFERMKTERAESLTEALQRILFWSSLFWQTKHELVGLGRLDYILNYLPLPENDCEIEDIIIAFYECLHEHYDFKSSSMRGDTGQVIILGGQKSDRTYFANRLTYLFISALMRYQKPDPKILLRTANNMPEDLLALAMDCMVTGIGSPLLSNDDRVIPAMQKFAYDQEDAYQYVVSACWEPLVYGRSFDQNNIGGINFADAVVQMYTDDAFVQCDSWNAVYALYEKNLMSQLDEQFTKLYAIQWERAPLQTLFVPDCLVSGKDISQGGAKYSHYGILSVGMGNAVNSLLNIQNLVFDTKEVTLSEIRNAALQNFENAKKLSGQLYNSSYWGTESKETYDLIEKISKAVDQKIQRFSNPLGGKLKWGLSSPGYIMAGSQTKATLDGRENYDALSVHISSPPGVAPTEFINFASQLDYSGLRSNGNVVDLIFSPTMIQQNKEKLLHFLKVSICSGVFQMQINAVSSQTLIAAKNNPELYPNLIVRVWGFSAYFNDLPEEYKDTLIRRTLESEQRS